MTNTTTTMLLFAAAALALGCKGKENEAAGKGAPTEAKASKSEQEPNDHDDHDHDESNQPAQKGKKDDHAQGKEDDHAHGKEEKSGGGEGHEEIVTLTPEAMRSAGIEVSGVTRQPLRQHIRASAKISLPPDRTAKVAARVPGRIATLSVRPGQKVKRSTVLAMIESPDLGRARADYLAAATKARVAEANFRREKNLLAKGITSEREMRDAESAFVSSKADVDAADARLHAFGLSDADIGALRGGEHYSSRFPVRSSLDGTLIDMDATVGQTVDSVTPLFTVGDLSELWVLLDVFESQVGQVRAGQHVHVTVNALPGSHFDGHVDHVGDVVDDKSRAVKVRVVIPNADRALKPGMFATAEIGEGAPEHGKGAPKDAGPVAAASAVLVVPRAAVQQVGADSFVFVPQGETKFRAVKIRTGRGTAQELEVTAGLSPNARIVVKGAFILKSELMKESMGEGHAH